jgi:hypothetical protein
MENYFKKASDTLEEPRFVMPVSGLKSTSTIKDNE